MSTKHTTITGIQLFIFLVPVFVSCNKLVEIPPPRNTISTIQIFNTEAQAENAMAGLYSRMINHERHTFQRTAATEVWSAGAVRTFTGLSSGEIYKYGNTIDTAYGPFLTNRLTLFNSNASYMIWKSAYSSIYIANSIVEGIEAAINSGMPERIKKEYWGEAKFVRAFAYFYLTNLYGDIPLVLTVDFHQTAGLARTPQQSVYKQIIDDLKDAIATMPADYAKGKGERIRPNKWTATALLARAYLFTGEYEKAAAAATEVIDQQGIFQLETELEKTFLIESKEALWQLKQMTTNASVRSATPEGYVTLPLIINRKNPAGFCITDQLLNAFEAGDKRRKSWVDSTDNSAGEPVPHFTYYPAKYKRGNSTGAATEYYVMMRLAEIFLIRAEARAHGATGGLSAAVDDLNIIRRRAGLDDLPESLGQEDILSAIEQERQVELFAEWGHRWLDLKRTKRAHDVLSNMPVKQPWQGDYQLLYPIPYQEIELNINLTQNNGYN